MHIKRIKISFLVILLACMIFKPAAKTATSAAQPEFNVIIGEWVRYDGDYTISVRDVNPDGSVDAGYFNPGKINIAEANASLWKGLMKLFIKLQDKGYPGSTYTLYYYPEKDALAGFYYQAAIGQTYEVVFLRKKVE